MPVPSGRLTGLPARAGEAVKTARPSADGALHVDGAVLADEHGKTAVLRGLSTHGLAWFPDFVDESFFLQLSEDWDCSLIRLAMYSDVYCRSGKDRQDSLSLMKKGIDAAIAADMYVIADWHILNDGNPLTHREEAAEFFRTIAGEYAGTPNILYEICNEPNGGTTWADIRSYAQEIIPDLHTGSPDVRSVCHTDLPLQLAGAPGVLDPHVSHAGILPSSRQRQQNLHKMERNL